MLSTHDIVNCCTFNIPFGVTGTREKITTQSLAFKNWLPSAWNIQKYLRASCSQSQYGYGTEMLTFKLSSQMICKLKCTSLIRSTKNDQINYGNEIYITSGPVTNSIVQGPRNWLTSQNCVILESHLFNVICWSLSFLATSMLHFRIISFSRMHIYRYWGTVKLDHWGHV